MSSETSQDRYHVHTGDCLEVLKTLSDDSVDSMVTDPPAGISFMGKKWDSDKGGPAKWRAWLSEVMKEALRVLKPGAHGLVWSIPRTSHWTGMALENAGFEIRDVITHHFGSGFPKNHDVSKAIDKAAGVEREIVGRKITGRALGGSNWKDGDASGQEEVDITAPAPAAAKQWEGWGTALKPSSESWWLVRKPLEKNHSIARNVMKWGTGALNVDGCRIGDEEITTHNTTFLKALGVKRPWHDNHDNFDTKHKGRWPPNTLFTHDARCSAVCVEGCPVGELDDQSGISKSSSSPRLNANTGWCVSSEGGKAIASPHNDQGGASRFFPCFRYQAKPSSTEKDAGLDELPLKASQKLNPGGLQNERDAKASAAIESQGLDARGRTLIRDDGSKTLVDRFIPGHRANNHPTVKPIALMAWLCRLITPTNGIVLDPFTGSGTTGCGAMIEGFRFCGIEMNPEFVEIAKLRMDYWQHHDLDEEPKKKAPEDIAGQIRMF